ncbi:MAG: hypothetical protein ACREUZ_02590, partial [Burkholderiales bacterium]
PVPAHAPRAARALPRSRHHTRMVNGTFVARTSPRQGYAHRFTEPGRYEITAFDDSGLYDRISLSVR